MNEYIYKVDVSEDTLTFTETSIPEDFESVAVEKEYDEENGLNGMYHGDRSYGAKVFHLFRKRKYQRPDPPDNGEYFRLWRDGPDKKTKYAWIVGDLYEYKGGLYTKGVSFM